MAVNHNKFLTFLLGSETYGIHILKVKEIIGMMTITQVPKMPSYVKGVINLRGKIIPVMDLRIKFGMEERTYDDRTCIIVTEIQTGSGPKLSGLVVDTVSEVLDVPPASVELPPSYSMNGEQDFLTGLGKVKDKVILLLDTEKILTDTEKDSLGGASREEGIA
ncbi:MAG: chemotaxis protein CheW [Clostridia bacterium]|nr:chemotaxis protein CheW [Clostridia bacterium]